MENNAGYVNDASFSFEGNPESFNVEQEVENTVGGLVYDPYRLSEVLVTIGEKMTGIPLYEYQRGLAFRIIYSILARDGAEITALFSRQSGKSEVIVFCVIVLGILLPVLAKIYPKELGYYSNGIKIGLFAPQGEQVQTVYQRCVARLHSEPVRMFLDDPDILDAPTSSVHFKLKSGTHVTGQSAAKQSKIESKTYNLVFIDECVAENTKVITKRGELPISDVTIGDYVLTQKSGKRVWDEVTNHWSYGEREVYEVTLSDDNKISTTLNHRFYTNFGWLTLNEIIFYRFAGLTINTYLYDEQKLSYEKVNRTTNIRNTVGRRLHRLCGQEVLQKSEVSSESLHQTKGVGGHEVRSSERAYSISSSSKGEQRVWKNELYVLNKVSTNNEEIPQYLLHELREKTRNKRVVINANIGGDSVLVYGRWKSDGVGKSTGYFYPQFFVGRGEATPRNVGKVWFYECDTVNEKWIYLSNALKGEEQILQSNRTIHDSEYVVQDSQFRDLEEMCDLSARVYIQPENIESLLERVQRRSEKEILQLRRVQKISEREEEEEVSRGCRVSTKGLRVEQVVSVEAKGAEKIYDISTKETQSFFGNGVLIHNSQDVDTEKVRKSIIPMTASCVCAGTMVYNERGQRLPIEKFVDTETKIIGYDGSDSFADTISWKQNKTGKKECFRITTNSGRTLECSFDHPILAKPRDTRKLEYINTEKLSVGTQIAIIDKVDLFGNEYMINPRLVGMLIGDGNYTKDTTVSFSNADKELWSFIENTHKVTYSKNSHITKDGRLYKEGTIPGLCDELRKLGIYGQVSKSKRLPDNIDQYRREDILELIGGLFDTDGTICVRDGRRGSISITAVGLPLIQDVFFLLDKLGIHGRIDFVKPNILGYAGLNAKGAWKYTINEKISIERFCREIKLLVPAKQAKLNKLVAIFSNRKAKRQKNIEGLYFERVTSIQPLGVQTIYNLSAETHQNYVSNGIVTHNTFGTVVRTGTPGRNKGDFYYVIQNNKKDDKKLTSPKQKLKFQKHFEFNYKDVIRYKREQYKKDGKDFHLLYEKAVLRDKKSSGENSDYFRMSYRIEWLLDVGMFITEERLSDKVYNKKIIFPKTIPTDFVVAGLDIASARANTVLTTALLDTVVQEFGERPIKTLTSWTVLNDLNYEEQFHIIANALLEHNVKVLYSDYTGVGRALTDILMYHLGELIEIIPYTFTPSSKSDMWKALDEDIENGRLIVPAHRTVRETNEFKMFDEQMLNLQKYWKGSFMVCEKTQGFKDDFCDSLGMCNLAGNHLYTPSTSVEITSNNLLGTGYRNNLRNNSRW